MAYLDEKKRLEEDFNNQLLQSRIEVQEHTFLQIGKELHDNVGQLLSTTRMLIGLTERSLQTPPDTLLTANATLGNAITELRTLSKSLDKEWLDQFDFVQNLETSIERINTGNEIKATLSRQGNINLPDGKRIILYRIVQEAMQNAIKHSHCTKLDISINCGERMIIIQIKDDGEGFDSAAKKTGLGLTNMKHRTQLLNGTLEVETKLGKGTNIILQIPERL